jgi:DNA-binding transcriptional regulator YhcF (GntR family)
MTPRLQRYVFAIDKYFRENDQLPSCMHLAEMVGVTNNAAAEAYWRLEREGVVSRNAANKFKRGPHFQEAAL